MADIELLGNLTPDRRFALSYAPHTSRGLFIGLYALDARLEAVVRSAREPVLGQLKLAWWRDRLAESPEDRPRGEPVLANLTKWGEQGAALAGLVNGWEHQLGEDPGSIASIRAFAQGRAEACAALASLLGGDPLMASRAGRAWALLDLGALQGPSPALRAAAEESDWEMPVLPHSLRPLLVHFGIARRTKDRDFAVGGIGDLLAAMRLGLLGI